MNRIHFHVAMGLLLGIMTWVACEPVAPPTEPTTEQSSSNDASTTEPSSHTESAPTERPTPPTPDLTKNDTKAEPPTTPDKAGKEPTKREPTRPDTPPTEVSPEPSGPEKPVFTGLTYWKDAKAILDTKCGNCHSSKGIGPFALDTYAASSGVKALIKAEVTAGRMPPWQADRSCGDYTNDISLTDTEKAKLLQWIDQGAKEGDPKTYVKPPPPKAIGLSRIDLSLQMKAPYTVKTAPDDYRCFVVDWTPTKTKFVTGFQVTPGNAKIVHHVIAYVATKSEASRYTTKDPNGGGYRCYGTAGGPAGLRWIGVWAPGVPGAEYATGTGIRVEPGSKIIIQVHYNVAAANKETDQTKIDFKLEDKIGSEAILFPYTNPQWLNNKKMKIPAGQKDVKHSFSFPLSYLGLIAPKVKGITVYSSMLHMHQLGTSGRLSYGNKCMLNIPKWDFNWQLVFHLKKPIQLGMNDSVGITCRWNNSQANQPIIDGKQKTSADVYWGDGTHDEMCLGIVYITCQDDQGTGIKCPDLSGFIRP